MAAGAEVARQRQVQRLCRCRLGFAAGRLAGCLVLVAQICLPNLSGQRQASGASFARPSGTGSFAAGSVAGLLSLWVISSAHFLLRLTRNGIGSWSPWRYTAPRTSLGPRVSHPTDGPVHFKVTSEFSGKEGCNQLVMPAQNVGMGVLIGVLDIYYLTTYRHLLSVKWGLVIDRIL